MNDPFRVYIVYEPKCKDAATFVAAIRDAFDSVGMRRDGLRFSVPVLTRSEPWDAQGPLPRPIDLAAAEANLLLVLEDGRMQNEHEKWQPYLDDLRRHVQERPHDKLVPVLVGGVYGVMAPRTQSVRLDRLSLVQQPRDRTRLMVRLLNAILVQQEEQASGQAAYGHTVFVSHAKRDGNQIAMRIVDLIQRVNESLGPRCFFDADGLEPGALDYQQRFEDVIRRGSLLALVTPHYHGRPWCRWEVLTAKKHNRPVVVADLTDGRIERTFPYLGNLPSIRVSTAQSAGEVIPDEAIEQLACALLSESLRILLWSRSVAGRIDDSVAVCVRPPELSDLSRLRTASPAAKLVLYPDPPLTTEEMELLQEAAGPMAVRTLSETVASGAGDDRGRALQGSMVALSVSEVPDPARLGVPEDQMDRVLEAVLTPLVQQGARTAYGGRVEAQRNFTLIVSDLLAEAYRRLDVEPGSRPFVHFLTEHRANADMPLLAGHLVRLAPYGEVWVTTKDGVACRLSCNQPTGTPLFTIQQGDGSRTRMVDTPEELQEALRGLLPKTSPDPAESFTHMRRMMAASCHARIVVGGRRTGFTGKLPGLCEEACCTIDAGKPLFVLGGFGGSARDIAIALGLLDEKDAFPYPPERGRLKYGAGMAEVDARRDAFEKLFDNAQAKALRELAATDSVLTATDMLLRVLLPRLRT